MHDSPGPMVTPTEAPGPLDGDNSPAGPQWSPKVLFQRAERSHNRIPGIRKIPFRALAIIILIALLNAVVWIAAAIVLVSRLVRVWIITNLHSITIRKSAVTWIYIYVA